MSAPPGIGHFPGGLKPDDLPRSSGLPTHSYPPLAPRLIFPLLQSRGIELLPRVVNGQTVLKGQILADHPDHPPIHASSSGVVETVTDWPLPYPTATTGPCLVIHTDGLDASVNRTGTPLPAASPQQLFDRLWQAGIVGLGGAGFPTTDKLRAPALHTLILNAAECEPLASADLTLLTQSSHRVLDGARLLCHSLGISRCFLALEADKIELANRLQQSLRQTEHNTIELRRIPVRYPTGSERQLIQVLTGKEVPLHGRPQDLGIVCLNVATVAAIHDAMLLNRPLTERWITLTGQGIHTPHNLWVKIGTPVADLIQHCGGYRPGANRLVMGGSMMGYPLLSDQVPIIKSSYCIWVAGVNESTDLEREHACIRCGACVEVCPAGLMPQELYRNVKSSDWSQANALKLEACIDCGCCNAVCPSHIPLVQHFMAAKKVTAHKIKAQALAHQAKARYEARLARKAREEQERAENARRRKDNLEKNRVGEIQGALARLKAKRV